jgi:hypothetical protein
MNYYYLLILLFPLYRFVKYLLYRLNLVLLFRGIKKFKEFNKQNIENFFNKYNNQDIIVDNFNLRSEGDYLDCLYLQGKNKNYITIYFHGNRGNIYDCLYKNDIKNILTYSNVFLFDYRGYGNSTGHSDEHSIITDSIVIYYFVLNVIGYPSENIIFYGNSLGGFISINMVSYLNNNRLPIPKGLIIQSPFYSLYEISKKLYPFLHYFMQYNPDNSKLLKTIKNLLPIIILHSTQDEYIDIKHSKMLYEENSDKVHFNNILGIHDMIHYENNINNFIKKIFKINL